MLDFESTKCQRLVRLVYYYTRADAMNSHFDLPPAYKALRLKRATVNPLFPPTIVNKGKSKTTLSAWPHRVRTPQQSTVNGHVMCRPH